MSLGSDCRAGGGSDSAITQYFVNTVSGVNRYRTAPNFYPLKWWKNLWETRFLLLPHQTIPAPQTSCLKNRQFYQQFEISAKNQSQAVTSL
jgi:hypothetical protein